jgi:DNA-binding protein H-NS
LAINQAGHHGLECALGAVMELFSRVGESAIQREFKSGWEDLLMKLENMSAAKLKNLRAEVDAMIATKLVERRQHLETELSKLAQIVGERPGRNSKGGGQSVAVKYRNPENVSQIWSGRGRRPLWLDAQIKAGKELELFLAA